MSFATRLRTALDVLLGPPVETRASAVGALISGYQVSQPQFPPRNSAAFASEAYAANTVAYFCISVLADAFGSLSLQVFRGDNEVKDHPVLDLLSRPNPTQGGARFRRALMSHYLIGGVGYVEAVAPGKGTLLPRQPRPPTELWTHRPDRVQVIPGPNGVPQAFRFQTGGGYKDFQVDQLTGRGYLLQLKDFHPLNDWYGLGGVEAAARWIDLGNAGATANAALMANGGNPSALFATKSNLTDPQREQMRARLRQMYSGAENTGQPLIVGGEWTVTRLAATMADMQWTEGMHEAARNICAAFRVPHILVVPGESTYANREAADLELYDHAVLPRADILLEDLSGWFRWLYGEDDLRLEIDIEAIPALETRREGKRKAVRSDALAGIISIQEARSEGGYGEVDKSEDFLFGPFAPLPPAPIIAAPGVGGLPGKPAAPGAKPPPGGKPAAGAKPPPGAKPRLVAIPGGKPGAAPAGGKGEQESKLRPRLPVAAGPLYAALRVDPASAEALAAWAADQGVEGVVDPAEMHVTTVRSRTPVPLYDIADNQTDVAYPGGHALRILGSQDEPALVLTVESRMADERHATAARFGAAWDLPDYLPHITLAQPFTGVVPTSAPPFAIGLGPEYAEPLDAADKAAPADQPRHPVGFPAGGQWKPRGPDDPPTAAELAAAEALAAELLDDDLLTEELAPVLSDAADHFARRGRGTEGEGPFILGAWLDDPARHRLAEFRAAAGSRSSLIGETTMALLALALARAIRSGTDLPSAVRGTFSGFEDARVPLVATTETVRAAGYGTQLSIERDGFPFKEWLCVVGETRVAGLGVSHVARRPYRGRLVTLRSASGRVVTVTADHPVLTGRGWVAAHLIEEGDRLVRYVGVVEGSPPGAGVVPYVEDMPPTIEEVFGSLHELATRPGVVPLVVDLQRHGAHGEIDVVAVDGDLLAHVEPPIPQYLRQGVLELTDLRLAEFLGFGHPPSDSIEARLTAEGVAPCSAPGDGSGLLLRASAPVEAGLAAGTDAPAALRDQALDDGLAASQPSGYSGKAVAGGVDASDLGSQRVEIGALRPVLGPETSGGPVGGDLSLTIAGPREHQGLPLPASTALNAIRAEQVPDLAGGAAQVGSDLSRALSGGVAFDYDLCLSVDIGPETETHVYDYSTANGWMIGNGLIIHNSQRDGKVRHAHRELDGVIVRTEDYFHYGDDRAMFPGDFSTPALSCNCRCVALPLRSKDDAKSALHGADRDALWHAYDTELREFEARARDAVRRGFEAQERRAVVRLHERDRGAA